MNRNQDSMYSRHHNFNENYISLQCIKPIVSRPQLVANLCSELLGPISGRLEILPDWPDLVYSLGILAPKSSSDDLGELEDLSNISEGEFRSEDNEGDANVEAPPRRGLTLLGNHLLSNQEFYWRHGRVVLLMGLIQIENIQNTHVEIKLI